MAASDRVDLAEAVANAHISKVRSLVQDEGCAIDKHGADGLTPLCVAAIWGNDEICAYLLSQGADPNVANVGKPWIVLCAQR